MFNLIDSILYAYVGEPKNEDAPASLNYLGRCSDGYVAESLGGMAADLLNGEHGLTFLKRVLRDEVDDRIGNFYSHCFSISVGTWIGPNEGVDPRHADSLLSAAEVYYNDNDTVKRLIRRLRLDWGV